MPPLLEGGCRSGSCDEAVEVMARWVLTAGGLLQFFGVLLIFWEISDAERTLGQPSWVVRSIRDAGRLTSVIQARVLGRKLPGHPVSAAADFMMRYKIEARGRVTPAEGTTVDERLDSHRRALKELRKEFDQLWAAVNKVGVDQRASATEMDERLSREISALRVKLEGVGGGSLRVRAWGGVLILAGTGLIIVGTWL